jgi:hypothetical protein
MASFDLNDRQCLFAALGEDLDELVGQAEAARRAVARRVAVSSVAGW